MSGMLMSMLTAPNCAWQWVTLVQQLVNKYPQAAKMTMLDLLNEPDYKRIGWTYGGPWNGMANSYLRAMDALYKVAPSKPL